MVYRTKTKKLRLDKVMMMGQLYDFIFDPITGELSYRNTRHLGGTFAPISSGPRYDPSVNRVLKEVRDRFAGVMLCN